MNAGSGAPLLSPIAGLLRVPSIVRPDGTRGYYMRRGDDCLQAAVATCLQVPMEEVPDWRVDARLAAGEAPDDIATSGWELLEGWLRGRGLRMLLHFKLPAARRRWIGIIPVRGVFASHCLVMDRSELLFDPAPHLTTLANSPVGRLFLGDTRHAEWLPHHAKWGLSFVRVNDRRGVR